MGDSLRAGTIIIIIIIIEYPEAGQRPLFPPEVNNIYTNINQN